jgi:hypothetical protein
MNTQTPEKFNLKLPVGYAASLIELANAVRLLTYFGYKSSEETPLLDVCIRNYVAINDVEIFLENCVDKLQDKHGPINPQVYEIINKWFEYTTQEDRISTYDR